MGDNNNIILAGLAVYCVLLNFIIIPSYASEVQAQYDARIGGNLSNNVSVTFVTGNNATISITDDTSTIGFLKALFITVTEIIPWYLSLIFIVLPDLMLIVIIYDKIRGI